MSALQTERLAYAIRTRLMNALATCATTSQLRTALIKVADDCCDLRWLDPVDVEALTQRDPVQGPCTEREAESAPAVPVDVDDEWLKYGGAV